MILQVEIASGLESSALGSVVSSVPGETSNDRAERGLAAMIGAKIVVKSRIDAQAAIASSVNQSVDPVRLAVAAQGAITVSVV